MLAEFSEGRWGGHTHIRNGGRQLAVLAVWQPAQDMDGPRPRLGTERQAAALSGGRRKDPDPGLLFVNFENQHWKEPSGTCDGVGHKPRPGLPWCGQTSSPLLSLFPSHCVSLATYGESPILLASVELLPSGPMCWRAQPGKGGSAYDQGRVEGS